MSAPTQIYGYKVINSYPNSKGYIPAFMEAINDGWQPYGFPHKTGNSIEQAFVLYFEPKPKKLFYKETKALNAEWSILGKYTDKEMAIKSLDETKAHIQSRKVQNLYQVRLREALIDIISGEEIESTIVNI